MKKFVIVLVIIGLGIGGYFGYGFVKEKIAAAKLEKIKEGWHVEVLNEYIKIRKDADRNSSELGEVKKGEIYAVDDMAGKNDNYWYHIEYEDGKYGWIANPKDTKYLKDINNPNETSSLAIKFYEDTYHVNSIDDIKYDHLEVSGGGNVKITHKVYHEVNESTGTDQYWILYTATDDNKQSTTKLQKIEFTIIPDESRVDDFATIKN